MSTTLRLTRTDRRDSRGGVVLELTRYAADGTRLGVIEVCSGAPSAQHFRQAAESRPKSLEPVPEGVYVLGDLEWAGGVRGDYAASWGEGLGPVWTDVIPVPGNPTRREAIGIHHDHNRAYAPGTAGCVGLPTLADVKTWAGWWKDTHGRPTGLVVDYGLGTVPSGPSAPQRAPVVHYLKIYDHDGVRAAVMPDGKRVPITGIKVNGAPFPGGDILIGLRVE